MLGGLCLPGTACRWSSGRDADVITDRIAGKENSRGGSRPETGKGVTNEKEPKEKLPDKPAAKMTAKPAKQPETRPQSSKNPLLHYGDRNPKEHFELPAAKRPKGLVGA